MACRRPAPQTSATLWGVFRSQNAATTSLAIAIGALVGLSKRFAGQLLSPNLAGPGARGSEDIPQYKISLLVRLEKRMCQLATADNHLTPLCFRYNLTQMLLLALLLAIASHTNASAGAATRYRFTHGCFCWGCCSLSLHTQMLLLDSGAAAARCLFTHRCCY